MDTFDLPICYLLNEPYLPPRCRKPRLREVEKLHTVRIAVVDEGDAPVVFSHDDCDTCTDAGIISCEYREHNGRLYVRMFEKHLAEDLDAGWRFSWTTPGDIMKKSTRFRRGHMSCRAWPDGTTGGVEATSEEVAVKSLDDAYDGIIFLRVGRELQVWRETSEPMYVITCFGLGNNHAGIGVWLSITGHYNPNINGSCYFRADQYDKAVSEAITIANRRGDTNSIPYIKDATAIVIHPGATLRRDAVTPYKPY